MDDTLELGTEFTTWAIKDFSANLRQQITREARHADCTVAEWLHGHFQRFGIAGQQVHPVKVTSVEPSAPPSPGEVDELCKLADASARVAETADRMPKKLRDSLNRGLRLATQSRLPPSKPRNPPQSALAAPSQAALPGNGTADPGLARPEAA